MAYGLLNDPPISGVAGADLTGKEGQFVKPTSTGDQWVLAGAGEFGLPLLLGAAAGRAISIYPIGSVAKMKAGAAVTAGAKVTSDTNGKVKTAVATSVSGAAVLGSNINGRALSTVQNADEIVSVLVIPMGADVTTAS